ncbi:MAG: isoaspartyl peptidase/L-asparaginase, partial [Acidobacteriota bacterium]
DQGFRKQDLLTDQARRAWKEWKRSRKRPEGHDTIGMIAMAADGTMAASCTTSGLAWKLPGRVGDSPLIGHGLYCDGKAGGAAATGIGEEVIKVCGSYQVVEFLRQGVEPEEAVRRVLDRILARDPALQEEFIGFVALRADGEAGFASTTSGFQAALYAAGRHRLLDAPRHTAS